MLNNILLLIISYLIGSVNFSIICSKFVKKQDVRELGSGNAGFTNMLRNYGVPLAAVVLLGDILKTVFIIVAAKIIFHSVDAQCIAALGVILGHNFPIFFGFKGGKGVVTTIASLVMIKPLIGIPLIFIAVGLMFLTGYVSIGSIVIFVYFPVMTAIFYHDEPRLVALGIFACILGLVRHRANIVRLIKGEENRFGKKGKGEL